MICRRGSRWRAGRGKSRPRAQRNRGIERVGEICAIRPADDDPADSASCSVPFPSRRETRFPRDVSLLPTKASLPVGNTLSSRSFVNFKVEAPFTFLKGDVLLQLHVRDLVFGENCRAWFFFFFLFFLFRI